MSEMKDRSDMPKDEMKDPMPAQRPPTTSEPVRPTTERPPAMESHEPRKTETMMWPDMTDLHRRFHELESEFIEDPKAAVRKAEQLMQEAVQTLTKSMHDKMQSMHRDVDGKDGDTEMLRQTMRGYRVWIESMEGRRAA